MKHRGRWHISDSRYPCPVCGKRGCSIDMDRGWTWCWRVAEGARATNGAGSYLHRTDDLHTSYPHSTIPDHPEEEKPTVDMLDEAKRLHTAAIKRGRRVIAHHAAHLGVSVESLIDLRIGWDEQATAWTFPMRDADGRVCGIRYRAVSGKKWAATGSRNGLFYVPRRIGPTPLMIPEGPTDTAALLTMGFSVIGRPSAGAGLTEIVRTTLARSMPVVIVADDDQAGREAARRLGDMLAELHGRVWIFTPPTDARAFLLAGGTAERWMSVMRARAVPVTTDTAFVMDAMKVFGKDVAHATRRP